MNLQDVIGAIHSMDSDELNTVVENIKMRRSFIARQATRTMRVGDAVSFVGKRGRVVGEVIKINRKTVIVDSPRAGRWRVTASMLTPLED